MKKQNNEDEVKITYRDVYKTLWRCRDFELSHLWQRSVMLTAFLILTYTGYGFLIGGILKGSFDLMMGNFIAFSISLIGIVLSMLWIMMAKGSKFWFESYEAAIDLLRNVGVEGYENVDVVALAGQSPLAIITHLRRNPENQYRTDKPSSCDFIMDTHAGRYSVSKINIFLGMVSIVVWILIAALHICISHWGKMAFCHLDHIINDPVIMIFILLSLIVILYGSAHLYLKSGDVDF